MLETVDLSQSLSAKDYKKVLDALQLELGRMQRRAHEAGLPVVVLFEGWEAAGKGTCINRLVQRLDPRGFKVHPISGPTQNEKMRPFLWRFAIRMPQRGRIAIFDRSWYGRVLVERIDDLVPQDEWRRAYEEILQLERQLVDDGAVIVKFWLHISKKEQRRRFKKITRDPAVAWKVGVEARREHRRYRRYLRAVEEMLERTSTAQAPWTIVEATDGRYARVKVLETIIAAIERGLEHRARCEAMDQAPVSAPPARAPGGISGRETLLERVDLSQRFSKQAYTSALGPLQRRLRRLEHEIYLARIPVVILYEGWDAAGKGGNIKRLTEQMDPRGYEVIPVAAPTQEELEHHYLWRFWRQLPKAGHLTIYDRSWYGRVLVERIEGFCRPVAWQRAFQEINEFERSLATFDTVVVKFWIHLSQKEQLRRFKERQKMEHKMWKLTDEDWRNRERWPLYHEAVVDMVQRTSTTYAPWTIIAGDDKYFARIQALRTVVQAIEAALRRRDAGPFLGANAASLISGRKPA